MEHVRTRPATIADVAARAGVGASTVSRVLNGGQVSGTRARPRPGRDGRPDYRPRASARSLVTGATETLALVIPFFTHPVGGGAHARRPRRGRRDATTSSSSATSPPPRQRDAYLGRRAPLDRSDGLLIVSLAPRDDEADAFLRAGAPVVLLDAFHPNLPCLGIDDVAGGMLATRHLIELGHERIAFVGDRDGAGLGSSPAPAGARATAALREAGLPVRPRAASAKGRTAGSWPTG